ncbi:S1 RNA-binding domain-containing protein [Symbioplanes lichenis]|uniref:S1 RNA-binding domain-containing protein n=1 Tax=Symbioplanes lichenis TaxID=1629072 RepID=UPI0027393D3A|nr:S1 RNA-binding domain-containing protein [Actinoplanes lichenis]
MSSSSPEPGTVIRGIVSEVHNFGVFVRLDGDPADRTGRGFIRIPELAWEDFDDAADVVGAGQPIVAAVLDYDPARGQVQLSLKALREDPLVAFSGRVGDVLSGPVVKVAPLGVFVRVAPGIVGLLPASELRRDAAVGDVLAVTVAEVDRPGRRVRLAPAAR